MARRSAFSSVTRRRMRPPSSGSRSHCRRTTSIPGTTAGRSDPVTTSSAGSTTASNGRAPASSFSRRTPPRAAGSRPRRPITYARIQEGKPLVPVILGDDPYIPPLLRPLARIRIESIDAIGQTSVASSTQRRRRHHFPEGIGRRTHWPLASPAMSQIQFAAGTRRPADASRAAGRNQWRVARERLVSIRTSSCEDPRRKGATFDLA